MLGVALCNVADSNARVDPGIWTSLKMVGCPELSDRNNSVTFLTTEDVRMSFYLMSSDEEE